MQRLFRTLVFSLAVCLLLGAPAFAQSQTLYAASGSNGVAGILYTIDITSGAATPIAPITNAAGGGGIGITGLAFNPINSLLYGITTNSTSSGNTVQSSLVTINLNTGVATVIGSLGFANSDISFRSDGTLFGYEANPNGSQTRSMTTIDLTTGVATRIGTSGLGVTNGGGLAFNSLGLLYLSATGDDGTLDTLVPATGMRTVGPGLMGGPFAPLGKGSNGVLNAMAFDVLGILYAIDSDRSSVATTHLVTVDPTTGQIIDLGISADNLDALAFAPIPEPSSLVLGAIGLGGLLVAARRRRCKGA